MSVGVQSVVWTREVKIKKWNKMKCEWDKRAFEQEENESGFESEWTLPTCAIREW